MHSAKSKQRHRQKPAARAKIPNVHAHHHHAQNQRLVIPPPARHARKPLSQGKTQHKQHCRKQQQPRQQFPESLIPGMQQQPAANFAAHSRRDSQRRQRPAISPQLLAESHQRAKLPRPQSHRVGSLCGDGAHPRRRGAGQQCGKRKERSSPGDGVEYPGKERGRRKPQNAKDVQDSRDHPSL